MSTDFASRVFEYAAYGGLLAIAAINVHWVWPLAMARLL